MFGLPRIVVIYAVAIPLALFLGYATSNLAEPSESTFVMVGLVLFVLALPLIIRWHHGWLVFFWNASFDAFFLPAQPPFWLLLAALSFGISWLDSLLGQKRFMKTPELTRPLLFLTAVVVLTGFARGGLGVRVLGSAAYGGKSYFYVFGAIMGFFALASVRVPVEKARRAVSLFYLSGTTSILSNLTLLLGPSFYFLYLLLPSEYAISEAQNETMSVRPESILRISGLVPAGTSIIFWMMAKWGIRGLFDFRKPWRLIFFCVVVPVTSLGGFRNITAMLGLLLVCQFIFEGLLWTRFLPIFAGFGLCLAMALVLNSDRLPMSMQRAISFLPVKVDPIVTADTENSTQWRLDMWSVVIPEIPRYLLLGKGYSIDPWELEMAVQEEKSGLASNYEPLRVAGDYHSGPLSLIIPFGIWGVIGFLWLLGAGVRVLYKNQRFGDPALRNINTFFLACFITESILYITIFGAFSSQLYIFTGILGMSVALNGGVCSAPQPKPRELAAQVNSPALAASY